MGGVNALAPRVAATDVQADTDGRRQRINELVKNVGGPLALLGRLRPHRLVELNLTTAFGNDLLKLLSQHDGKGATGAWSSR